jgi:DNA-binding MarR family transcriptional regulator
MEEKDFVDFVVELWLEELPELHSTGTFDRLLRVAQHFEKLSDELCRASGVSFWAFTVLTALRRAGAPYELTPTDLYRSGMVTSGAVTKRVAELERNGLVQRRPDPSDGRGTLISLTAGGLALVEDLAREYTELQDRLLFALPSSKQKQIGDLLRPILLSLEGPQRPALSRTQLTSSTPTPREAKR